MNSEIDWHAVESMRGDDINKLSMQELPKKYTAKTVNFCPYCRALVGAVSFAPFLYLWRLFPHKPKGPMTIEQIRKSSRRRTWISLGVAAGINITFGLWKLLDNDWTGIIQIIIGVTLISAPLWGPGLLKAILYMSRLMPKRKKVKEVKTKEPRKPSAFAKKLHDKHDLICPPIFFIDKQKEEKLK